MAVISVSRARGLLFGKPVQTNPLTSMQGLGFCFKSCSLRNYLSLSPTFGFAGRKGFQAFGRWPLKLIWLLFLAMRNQVVPHLPPGTMGCWGIPLAQEDPRTPGLMSYGIAGGMPLGGCWLPVAAASHTSLTPLPQPQRFSVVERRWGEACRMGGEDLPAACLKCKN